MLRSSHELFMMKIALSQLYVYVGREPLAIKYVTVSVSSFHFTPFRLYATPNGTDS